MLASLDSLQHLLEEAAKQFALLDSLEGCNAMMHASKSGTCRAQNVEGRKNGKLQANDSIISF